MCVSHYTLSMCNKIYDIVHIEEKLSSTTIFRNNLSVLLAIYSQQDCCEWVFENLRLKIPYPLIIFVDRVWFGQRFLLFLTYKSKKIDLAIKSVKTIQTTKSSPNINI